MKKSIRKVINILIILATLGAAVYFFDTHPKLIVELKNISVGLLLSVLGLYIVMLGVLVLILWATLKLANVRLPHRENLLLNSYSVFMNFFIPGQTGPAYRAYYLNKKYKLKILDYSIATIFYYMFYGLISILFLLAGSQPWYYTVGAAVIMGVLAFVGLKLYLRRFEKKPRLNLSAANIGWLIAVTFAQTCLQTLIYFIEVRSVDHHVAFHQVITYTGAANLALFAALTPGAIGIREGFLILSEKLHHIPSSVIVVANVIDRSVYIIFLALVGLFILIIKTRTHFELTLNREEAGDKIIDDQDD